MLEIAVHHRDALRLACEDPLQARARQTTPPDAPNATDARIGNPDLLGGPGGAIGRIVVDDDELPGNIGQCSPQGVDEARNVLPLSEGRNNDAELAGRPWPVRWRGLRIDSADAVVPRSL